MKDDASEIKTNVGDKSAALAALVQGVNVFLVNNLILTVLKFGDKADTSTKRQIGEVARCAGRGNNQKKASGVYCFGCMVLSQSFQAATECTDP